MQHLQKIDEASAAKFLLGRLISSQYGQIAHESFPPLATKLIAQMPIENGEPAAERART